jgi:hypothetical protein
MNLSIQFLGDDIFMFRKLCWGTSRFSVCASVRPSVTLQVYPCVEAIILWRCGHITMLETRKCVSTTRHARHFSVKIIILPEHLEFYIMMYMCTKFHGNMTLVHMYIMMWNVNCGRIRWLWPILHGWMNLETFDALPQIYPCVEAIVLWRCVMAIWPHLHKIIASTQG